MKDKANAAIAHFLPGSVFSMEPNSAAIWGF